jgi:peptide deformylase
MAILEIKTFPDNILLQKANPVDELNGRVQRLIDSMIETMYAAPGLGLAAPQVAVGQQLLVIDVSSKEESMPLIVLVNPEIIGQDGLIDSEEGCLSLPDFRARVRRAKTICVKAVDREGKPIEIEADGLLARAIQHEIDHLNGTLLLDKISSIRKRFFLKKIQKSQKRKS